LYNEAGGDLMENKSMVADKSFDFAVRIVKLYKYLCAEKKEYVLSKQMLRSGTSIGANIHEALYGQSRRDYLAKMKISLKEASETQYWLRLLTATEILTEKEANSITKDCVELIRMLTSIVKTTSDTLYS
jgi:four helix bundle protein